MAPAILLRLQNLWPFSLYKTEDDLKVSRALVHGLHIPEQTKQFVYAIRDPKTQAVVYVLAAQNLSEQSSLDAENLIKEVRPDAVVAQIDPSTLVDIQTEENHLSDGEEIPVPDSSFGVLKRCFVNKINSAQYENLAGGQVLRDIFGIGFYGHFLAAKNAAREVDSTFLLLESPFVSICMDSGHESGENDLGSVVSGLLMQPSNLIPGKVTSVPSSSSSKRFYINDNLQFQMVKLLSSLILTDLNSSSRISVDGFEPEECHPSNDFQAPSFAQTVYSLLTDLHNIFIDIPAIGKALVHAQKILINVDQGKAIDTQLLSEVHNFQVAVEGLRIALNSAALSPANKMENAVSAKFEFSELPQDEKCCVLFAQALKSQTKKFKSIVAIVDARSLAGLRKYWNTNVPIEVAELADHCFRRYDDDEEASAESTDKKSLLADKPVVAVGAGATAVIGASSLSKVVPASTLVKMVTYKIPVFLKIPLVQMQRTAAIGLAKILGPSKLLAPGVASSSAKTFALKLTVSAEKIRVVAHSVIASAERTSLQTMRTSFYEIMRRRQGRPVGLLPWAAFGCSVMTCTGLLVYGDGIECVAESVPSAPTIACLGRGLRSLHQASQEVRQTNSAKMHEAIKSLMYSLKKVRN
ncbi:hypothetical protein ACLOJK_009055 [Asimina triloba]